MYAVLQNVIDQQLKPAATSKDMWQSVIQELFSCPPLLYTFPPERQGELSFGTHNLDTYILLKDNIHKHYTTVSNSLVVKYHANKLQVLGFSSMHLKEV